MRENIQPLAFSNFKSLSSDTTNLTVALTFICVFCFFSLQYWGLNLELHACQASKQKVFTFCF
jgi:hypothetical protein